MLNQKILLYLTENLELLTHRNQCLLFLLKVRENILWEDSIEDELISKLTKDNIIGRNYIDRKFKLLVPFYDNDVVDYPDEISVNGLILDVHERINEYRTLFKGYRVGNMSNKQTVIDHMIRFILSNNTPFDEVLFATSYYIQNTEPKYITSAENFIYRMTDKGEISKLWDVIEELRLSKFESNML